MNIQIRYATLISTRVEEVHSKAVKVGNFRVILYTTPNKNGDEEASSQTGGKMFCLTAVLTRETFPSCI